jgi:hypothetical protein
LTTFSIYHNSHTGKATLACHRPRPQRRQILPRHHHRRRHHHHPNHPLRLGRPLPLTLKQQRQLQQGRKERLKS